MNFGKADDLTGAIRSAAVLYKDDLSGADLIQEQISKAITNEETKLPDYLQPTFRRLILRFWYFPKSS
jgi:uncharacterized protein YjbI with pentapeptide repeats